MLEYSRATQQDSKELAQRRLDYLREDLGSIAPEEEQTLTANLPRYFSKHLEKNLFAFVAKDSGRIVATALLVLVEKPCSPSFPRGRIGEVLSVYTMPQYRRKGIATELMKNLMDFSKEQELDYIKLIATKSGYPVYKKLGFQEYVSDYTEMRFSL